MLWISNSAKAGLSLTKPYCTGVNIDEFCPLYWKRTENQRRLEKSSMEIPKSSLTIFRSNPFWNITAWMCRNGSLATIWMFKSLM